MILKTGMITIENSALPITGRIQVELNSNNISHTVMTPFLVR